MESYDYVRDVCQELAALRRTNTTLLETNQRMRRNLAAAYRELRKHNPTLIANSELRRLLRLRPPPSDD